MARSTLVSVGAGIAEGEYQPSLEELQAISGSCLQISLNELNADQRSQLTGIIESLRALIESATDKIRERQGRVREQIKNLDAEIEELGGENSTVIKFFQLSIDAIASCPDVENAANSAKSLTDRTLAEVNELLYQKGLAQIQEGRLGKDLDVAAATLAKLDEMKVALA